MLPYFLDTARVLLSLFLEFDVRDTRKKQKTHARTHTFILSTSWWCYFIVVFWWYAWFTHIQTHAVSVFEPMYEYEMHAHTLTCIGLWLRKLFVKEKTEQNTHTHTFEKREARQTKHGKERRRVQSKQQSTKAPKPPYTIPCWMWRSSTNYTHFYSSRVYSV